MKTLYCTVILAILVLGVLPLIGQSERLIPYRNGDNWGFCLESGQVIIAQKYDSVRFFICDRAVVGIDNKFGYIDRQGEEITELKYTSCKDYNCLNKFSQVTYRNRTFYINSSGKRIRPKSILGAGVCGGITVNVGVFSYEFYVYQQGNKYGLISYKCPDWRADSCVVYHPLIYDDFKGFGNFLLGLKKGNKWGVLDVKHKQRQPFYYDDIVVDSIYPNGWKSITRVLLDGKYGLLNYEGEVVIEPMYDNIEQYDRSLLIVWVNGEYGYVDRVSGLEYFTK